jgi:2-keto-4-pentenoate hydratase
MSMLRWPPASITPPPRWSTPCACRSWLRHAARDGRGVTAGTAVTTGTWVGILSAQAGDLVSAEFPGIGRASVQL